MIQPRDLFLHYNDIYAKSFIILPDEKDGEYSVTLTEDDKTAKLKELKIYNVPKNTILLPLHKYSELLLGYALKDIFNADIGIFKCCDYLLITMRDNELYLIFIEMKSEKYSTGDIKRQFKGATCFIEYCNAAIRHFYDMPLLKSMPLNMRYYLVYQKGLNKWPTAKTIDPQPQSFDNFYRYNVGNDKSPSIYFGVFLPQTGKNL
jgi:hypothetical protein